MRASLYSTASGCALLIIAPGPSAIAQEPPTQFPGTVIESRTLPYRDEDNRLTATLTTELLYDAGEWRLTLRFAPDGPLVQPAIGFDSRAGVNRITAEEFDAIAAGHRTAQLFTSSIDGNVQTHASLMPCRTGQVIE